MSQSRLNPRVLLVLFLLAFAIRLAGTIATQGLNAPPDGESNPDQLDYEAIAYNLSTGVGYSITPGIPTAARAPGTAVTLLPAYLVFGRSYVAARVWITFLSALTCVLAAWLAHLCAGPRVGLVAGFWLAAYPGHLYYSTHFLSETAYGLWLTVAAIFTVSGLAANRRLLVAAGGLAWGAAILTRAEFILIVPLILSGLFLGRRWIGRQAIGLIALQTAVAVMVAGLWIGRNVAVFNAPVLSTMGGFVWWGAHNERTMTDVKVAGTWVNVAELLKDGQPLVGSDVERERQAWKNGTASIRRHWSRLPLVTAMKLWRLLSPVFETDNMVALTVMALGWIVTAPFVALGIWVVAKRRGTNAWRWIVAAAPMVVTVLCAMIFYGLPRFRDAVSPLMLGFAAVGLVHAWERMNRGHNLGR